MNRGSRRDPRVLAVDPTTRGVAFALLEGPEILVDWGTRTAIKDKNAGALRHVGLLLERYRPDVLVVEDVSARGSRRRERIRKLVPEVREAARSRRLRVRSVPRTAVLRAFSEIGPTTKPWIAGAIASQFPELAQKLPRRRKPWMSEDERMNIFDAVALGQTYFRLSEKKAPGRKELLA